MPLDLSARNVILVLRRVPLRRYAGSFSCAQLSVARQKPRLPPFYLAGRIDFSRDDLDITGLEWRLLDSSLHTAGITGRGSVSVRRLPSFVAEASVRAEGGFSTLARLFEVHELTGGNFTLVTNTVYHNGQLQSRGHFQAREVEIRSPRFTPLRVALSSDYAADRAHLQFPNLRAAVLNGEIQGRADVSLQRSTPMFAVRTQVRGISVSDVLESFREGQTLMRNLPLRAGLNGSVDASWSGKLQNFASHFDLRFSPAEAGTPAGSRPLAGTVRGTARLNGEPSITLEAGDFHLPHSSLTTQGTLGGPQSNLVAQAQTSDFEEVRRLIQELSDPPIEIPLRLKSMAVFSGSMSGPMMNPLVRGQLRAGAFELGGWSWGGFEGGVTVASTRAQVSSGKLVSGGSAIIFDLGAALEKWRLTPASLVRVSAQAQDISVERLRDALNFPYPVTGRVSGTVNVEGTRSIQAGNSWFPGTSKACSNNGMSARAT